MSAPFEAIIIVIWVVFAILAGAKGKKAGSNAKKAAAMRAAAEERPRKVSSEAKGYSSDKQRMQSSANTTYEKTHSHEGEVTGNLTIQEDRKNDWLARQIKEESRFKDWL